MLRLSRLSSLGQDYSVFPTISPTRKGYASQRAGEWGCPMSSFDEEFVTMIGGLTAFAAALRPCYGWVDAKLMPRARSLGEPIDRLPRPQNWPGLRFGMRARCEMILRPQHPLQMLVTP